MDLYFFLFGLQFKQLVSTIFIEYLYCWFYFLQYYEKSYALVFSYENSKLCSGFKAFPISKANHSIPKVGYFYASKYSNSKGCVHECESCQR